MGNMDVLHAQVRMNRRCARVRVVVELASPKLPMSEKRSSLVPSDNLASTLSSRRQICVGDRIWYDMSTWGHHGRRPNLPGCHFHRVWNLEIIRFGTDLGEGGPVGCRVFPVFPHPANAALDNCCNAFTLLLLILFMPKERENAHGSWP
jgi:hypothetical protein